MSVRLFVVADRGELGKRARGWLNLDPADGIGPGNNIKDRLGGIMMSGCCEKGKTHSVVTMDKD